MDNIYIIKAGNLWSLPPKPILPHPSEAHLYWTEKRLSVIIKSHVCTVTLIWHQICLWKKSLRLHIKIFVTTIHFPLYKKNKDHTLQSGKTYLDSFQWFLRGNRMPYRHWEHRGVLTQCWKVNLTHLQCTACLTWTKALRQMSVCSLIDT